jgi:hypothetical protein
MIKLELPYCSHVVNSVGTKCPTLLIQGFFSPSLQFPLLHLAPFFKPIQDLPNLTVWTLAMVVDIGFESVPVQWVNNGLSYNGCFLHGSMPIGSKLPSFYNISPCLVTFLYLSNSFLQVHGHCLAELHNSYSSMSYDPTMLAVQWVSLVTFRDNVLNLKQSKHTNLLHNIDKTTVYYVL